MMLFRRLETPTWLVVLGTYGLWGVATLAHESLPVPVLLLLGGLTVAVHGSLTHEIIHGHPTRWAFINSLLVFPALGLWMPFGIYRREHMAHHRATDLTDTNGDPESFYVSARQWRDSSGLGRSLLWFHQTLLGRLVVGPPIAVARLLTSEWARVRARDFSHVPAWAAHGVSVFLVVAWLDVCGLSVATYVLCFALPGLSLTLLRSFAEHAPHGSGEQRTAIVESRVLGWLFLHNNLHVIHHREPGLAWFDIPRRYEAARERLRSRRNADYYENYWTVARRYFLTPRDEPWQA